MSMQFLLLKPTITLSPKKALLLTTIFNPLHHCPTPPDQTSRLKLQTPTSHQSPISNNHNPINLPIGVNILTFTLHFIHLTGKATTAISIKTPADQTLRHSTDHSDAPSSHHHFLTNTASQALQSNKYQSSMFATDSGTTPTSEHYPKVNQSTPSSPTASHTLSSSPT